jgi:hypothetical protein
METKMIRVFTRETVDRVYEVRVPVDYDVATPEGDYPWGPEDRVDEFEEGEIVVEDVEDMGEA